MTNLFEGQLLTETTQIAESPIHVVYVVGSGRCGSTLLDRLLGQQPDVVSVGELNRIWKTGMVLDSLCSCGRSFSECHFWSRVTEQAFGNRNSQSGNRLHALRKKIVRFRKIPTMLHWRKRGLPQTGAVAEYARSTIRLYEAIRDVSGKNIIVDTSKNCVFPYFLSALPQLKLTVIHLIRDSRAVAYSKSKVKSRVPESEKQQNDFMPRYSPIHSAWDWSISNVFGTSIQWMKEVNYLQIKYEDLVSDS